MKETPILRFWRAVNDVRAEVGAPPMEFGDVMHWFGAIVVEAYGERELAPLDRGCFYVRAFE